jgi:hypothetical protein
VQQMPVRNTSRRQCRKYEREWNGYCVDRNLEDEWLIRLNDLEALGLISICEGHSGRQAEPARAAPHIKLRLKEHLLPGIARCWDGHKVSIVGEVNRLLQSGDTYVGLELKLRSRTGRLNYEESLMVGIHRRQGRTLDEMDAETRDWFGQSVGRVEALDDLVIGLWCGSAEPDT